MTKEQMIAKINDELCEIDERIFDSYDCIYSEYKDRDCISQHEFYQIINILQYMTSYVLTKHYFLLKELKL